MPGKKVPVVNNKQPPLDRQAFEDMLPRIVVEQGYKGQPDRVTGSLSTKVNSNGIFFSYSTDVGMYNKKETLKKAKIRAFNYVKRVVIAEKAKIK